MWRMILCLAVGSVCFLSSSGLLVVVIVPCWMSTHSPLLFSSRFQVCLRRVVLTCFWCSRVVRLVVVWGLRVVDAAAGRVVDCAARSGVVCVASVVRVVWRVVVRFSGRVVDSPVVVSGCATGFSSERFGCVGWWRRRYLRFLGCRLPERVRLGRLLSVGALLVSVWFPRRRSS